jgi:hypothetical protein
VEVVVFCTVALLSVVDGGASVSESESELESEEEEEEELESEVLDEEVEEEEEDDFARFLLFHFPTVDISSESMVNFSTESTDN